MSSVVEGNRFAPPTAHVEDVAVAAAGELAGRGARLVATLIDGFLAGAVFLLISLATPLSSLVVPDGSLVVYLATYGLLGFVVFLVLHGYLLATRGQTIGKALLRIRIVRSDGSKASLVRLAGLRYLVTSIIAMTPLLGWAYALVDSLLIFRESCKCLHDNIADTIVVKA